MKHSLAIIIPAYKSDYLERTLDSIADQTVLDFTLYIGDDNSPHNLKSIVDKYTSRIDIVYHRFADNLGGKDLVAQWDRCVKLSTHEPLIWFFSDDDIMPADGVERILAATKNRTSENRFLRFPLAVIDKDDKIITANPPQEASISSYQFMLDKLEGRISSAACEYVFSRATYDETGGFISFPMAWCSDDATWIKFSKDTGVEMLFGKPVCWRNVEGFNISNSAKYNTQKVNATAQFVEWLHHFWGEKLNNKEFYKALKIYLRTILRCSLNRTYTNGQLLTICKQVSKIKLGLALSIFLKHCKKV